MPARDPRNMGNAMRHLGVGVTFVVETGVFAGLGWWLDGRLSTTPWLLVAGMMGGLVLATWHLLRETTGNGKSD